MKVKFKVGDEFKLKKDQIFTRSFPMGGYNKDGSVRDMDKEPARPGRRVKVSEIYETTVATSEASYDLDFGGCKVHVSEKQLLDLFDLS